MCAHLHIWDFLIIILYEYSLLKLFSSEPGGWFWPNFGLLFGDIKLFRLLLSLFGLLLSFLGTNGELGAPELQIALKLRVTGTRNQREKVGHECGTYPYDFPMGVPLPGTDAPCVTEWNSYLMLFAESWHYPLFTWAAISEVKIKCGLFENIASIVGKKSINVFAF